MHEWESIKDNAIHLLDRCEVPGGWLYVFQLKDGKYKSTTFVPDPKAAFQEQFNNLIKDE